VLKVVAVHKHNVEACRGVEVKFYAV